MVECRGLGEEGLSASASLLDVGIVEDKLCTEAIFLPVHLASDDTEKRLAVDQHLYAVLLDTLVESACFLGLDVFKVVRHAGAALVAHTDTDELGPGLGFHQRA